MLASLAFRILNRLVCISIPLAFSFSSFAATESELIKAINEGRIDSVSAALESGVSANSTSADSTSALQWATLSNNSDIVRLLLGNGADANASNRYGVTAGALAAENGNSEIMSQLLAAGIDANQAMPEGESLIMTAARTGDADTVRVLLEHGANPNQRENSRGQNALMWAAAENNADAIRVLTEYGADIHIKTNNPSRGSTRPFVYPPPTGFSALLFAVRAGHMQAVIALLDAGANINDFVSDGQSALVIAAANANWELASLLIDRGADVNQANAGWNALHQTVRTRRMNLAFGTPGPFAAGTVDSIELMKKLLDSGIDVNARMTRNGIRDGQRNRFNRLGATAFMLAAKVTDVEAMRLLLEYGADANIPTADGTTPLMVAAGLHIWNPGEDGGSFTGQEEEVLEAVRICVAQGNDVNARNYRGETALHGVGFRGVNLVVDYLVERGADLSALTDDGWSPLAIARGFSYTDFYKAQLHTAERMEELMLARGMDTQGEEHFVPGSVCYDCLQTRADQIQAVATRDQWMEENFDPASMEIQMLPFWSWLPYPDPSQNSSVDVSTPRYRDQ
ncbi:MAG: ankyrin repeat domain-containing protein [Gammaproteobacteria bacterium]|nr:ankyrin repeat domain-containing protein [Gammaproteobacteria bacterium]MDD9957964.1 ankyrin repeat domain-containing protein [Gammaproteobacteria bacterium]